MTDRVGLQYKLEAILGARHVYFQPPENLKIVYPAIVYSINDISTRHADNYIYKNDRCYEAILIDTDPESSFIDKILELPKTRFVRSYISENLNHFVFYIYH